MDTFLYFVLFFAAYAFLGWVWEFVFIYATQRKFHWHGFLRVPLLPIYGFSAVAILLFVQPYIDNPFFVFLVGMLVVSAIELVTGLVLDKVFHMRLWDYRDVPMNIGGYTDLYTSLGFGAMSLFLVYVVQPWVASGVMNLSHTVLLWIGWTIVVVVAIDFSNSLSAVIQTRIEIGRKNGTLEQIQKRLARVAHDVRSSRGVVRRAFAQLQERNLAWLRTGFPTAETTRRKK